MEYFGKTMCMITAFRRQCHTLLQIQRGILIKKMLLIGLVTRPLRNVTVYKEASVW